MRIRRIALVALSALNLIYTSTGQPQPGLRKKLVLAEQTAEDKTRDHIPGSKWYVSDLLNNSDQLVKLEAIQMPGGYAGSGKFFACGLQVWNTRRREWMRLWASEVGPSPHFVDVEVNPGEHREACNMLLPAQAGAVGQCVRFRLRTRWQQNSSYRLVSKPFLIGDSAPEQDGPCHASH